MKRVKKGKVVVGLSGGVDSAVAAHLLKAQGYEVHAVFMRNMPKKIGAYACPWREDRTAAYEVAAVLGIPITTWNFEKEFKAWVLDDLFEQYRKGRTPNPDVICNERVKFDAFVTKAVAEGYDLIATGHYARVKKDSDGMTHLLRARDANKDQSYFLARVPQWALRRTMFPIGSLTKPRVREIARTLRLPNAERPESMGICFVGPVALKLLLSTQIKSRRGIARDTRGNILGTHDGAWYYTIGQRQGIGIAAGEPLYVVDKNVRRNELILGTEHDPMLCKKMVTVVRWHWVAREQTLPLTCSVSIRYRQKPETAHIRKESGRYVVTFARKQRAIAPGQLAVAFVGREVVGSGIIA